GERRRRPPGAMAMGPAAPPPTARRSPAAETRPCTTTRRGDPTPSAVVSCGATCTGRELLHTEHAVRRCVWRLLVQRPETPYGVVGPVLTMRTPLLVAMLRSVSGAVVTRFVTAT